MNHGPRQHGIIESESQSGRLAALAGSTTTTKLGGNIGNNMIRNGGNIMTADGRMAADGRPQEFVASQFFPSGEVSSAAQVQDSGHSEEVSTSFDHFFVRYARRLNISTIETAKNDILRKLRTLI